MDFLNTWKGKQVLVTGGTGFIGKHVISLGIQAGIEIHNISRHHQDIENVNSHQVDLRDRQAVIKTIRDIQPDGILHLAAGGVTHGTSSVADLVEVNVLGLQAICEAIADFSCPPPCVISGSWFEYAPKATLLKEGDKTLAWSPYAVSKLASYVVASYYAQTIPLTELRIFSVYGPGEQLSRLIPYVIESAFQNRQIELTPGKQIRDYTYVIDVARAFWYALNNQPAQHNLRVLNVGTGNGISLHAFIATLIDILKTYDIEPQVVFGAKSYRKQEIMHAVADVTKIRQELGWQPLTSLHEGLHEMVQLYKSKV